MQKIDLRKVEKSVIEKISSAHIPKIAQRLVLNNLCRYMYVLIHRQYGKSLLIRHIASDFLNADYPVGETPAVGIFASKLKQTLKLYRSKMHAMIELEGGKPRFAQEEGSTIYRRQKDNLEARVDYYAANFNPDTDRGGTYPFLALDEYGAFPANFGSSIAGPMGDVWSAPMIMTGTPLGPNHFKKEYDHAKTKMESGDKDFFALRWTIDDSLREGEVTQKQYDTIQKRYPPEQQHIFKGEYQLDWNAYLPNQIFGFETTEALNAGRVGFYPAQPGIPVDTFWDIGSNGTAVWMRQSHAGYHNYIRFIDQTFNVTLQDFIRVNILPLKDLFNFRFHVFPADMNVKDFSSSKPRIEIARAMLPGRSLLAPQVRKPLDLIERARTTFQRCRFHDAHTRKGFDRLALYCMKGRVPNKNEDSHGADAFVLSETLDDFFSLPDAKIDVYSERESKWKNIAGKEIKTRGKIFWYN